MFFPTLGLIASTNVITVTIQSAMHSAMNAAKDAGRNCTIACEARSQ